MEEYDVVQGVNVIPCIKWVRRGVAKANPEKVQLTEEELQAIIDQTKVSLKVEDEEGDTGTENRDPETKEENTVKQTNKEEDKYNFDKYDEEEGTDTVLAIGNLAVHASLSQDPYVTLKDEDYADSEDGDDVISTSDNLILVGHVEGDASILEVYVYNEEEGSLYVHHDFLLPTYPLCLEWLNFDPSDGRPGNLCAVGSMDPIIQVWDLDLEDCLEPAFKLGKKARSKKGTPGYGHKDAVLDLSWNIHLQHILASASADHTVLLWDLQNGQPSTKLECFMEKVQSLEFHPFEAQTLLTGSCDKMARVFDCREDGSFKSWTFGGEIERVIWNHFDPFYCIVSTSEGLVHYIDCRADKPLWQLSAHTKEVSGLCLSSQCPGMLLTSGSDGLLKTWDIAGGEPVFVHGRPLGIGGVLCLLACPESPFVVAGGGDKKSQNFAVIDICKKSAADETRFGSRDLIQPVIVPDIEAIVPDAEAMEISEPVASTSTSPVRPRKNLLAKPTRPKKLKKKKK